MTKFEYDVQQLMQKLDAGESLIGQDAAKIIATLIEKRDPPRYSAERLWVNTWIEKDYELMIRKRPRENPDNST